MANILTVNQNIIDELDQDETLIYKHLLKLYFYDPERDAISATSIGQELNKVIAGLTVLDRYAAWALPICKKLTDKGLLICDDGDKFRISKPMATEFSDMDSRKSIDFYNIHIRPHLNTIIAMRRKGKGYSEIEKAIGLGSTTLFYIAQRQPELGQILASGKNEAISDVERSLFDRANGYYYDEVREKSHYDKDGNLTGLTEKIVINKHVPPDPQSLKFFLLNIGREEWKSRDQGGTFIGKLSINALLGDVNKIEEKRAGKPLDPDKEVPMSAIIEQQNKKCQKD